MYGCVPEDGDPCSQGQADKGRGGVEERRQVGAGRVHADAQAPHLRERESGRCQE